MYSKLLLFLSLIFILHFQSKAQNEPFLPDTFALESVFVEKFYVSDAADNSDGTLPEGSITYRVYADLKPDYKVSSLTAFTSPTAHPISIQVTNNGQFYNNQFGSSFGNEVNELIFGVDARASLDSYLTIGAASSTQLGVPKYLDDDDNSILAGSANGYLFNEDPFVCPPTVQDQDGLFTNPISSLSNVGIPSDQLQRLGSMNSEGSFDISNGSWFVPGGVLGATEENLVLLGQFTTIGGSLEFDMNILVLIPEELRCNVIPSCQKASIIYTAIFQDGDSEHNENPEANNVHYQRDDCTYIDNGEPCILSNNNDPVLEANIAVFPNPVLDFAQLEFSKTLTDVELTLFDVNGRPIWSSYRGSIESGSTVPIDLSRFSEGTYILQVRSGDSSITKRIVKQ